MPSSLNFKDDLKGSVSGDISDCMLNLGYSITFLVSASDSGSSFNFYIDSVWLLALTRDRAFWLCTAGLAPLKGTLGITLKARLCDTSLLGDCMRPEVGFCLGVVFLLVSYLIRCGLCFLCVFCFLKGLLFCATTWSGFEICSYLDTSGSFSAKILFRANNS